MKSSTKEKGLSVLQATFPMVGSILGAGVLTLPKAVEKSGYLLSGPILLFISSICAFTLFQLVHCAKNLGKSDPSYFLVCQNAFPALGYIADACIGVQGLGSVFVYFLLLKAWISKLLGIDGAIVYLPYNIIFSLLLILVPTALAMQKDLKKLSFISIMSTASVVFLSAVVMLSGALSLMLPSKGVQKDTLRAYTTSPSDILAALSSYIFGLGCQQNMVRVFSLLEKPTKANGAKVGAFAIAIASFAYFLVANGGYIAGGNDQNVSILEILENKERAFYKVIMLNFGNTMGSAYFYLITVSMIAMSIVLLGAYPLQMHPTRDSAITFLRLIAKNPIDQNKRLAEIFTTAVLTALIFIGSLGNIKYTFVMNLIANTASCYIMFALPSISYILSNKKRLLFTILSCGILGGSILFSITETYKLFSSIIN
ncbi:uncharacterized protein NEMAJ01_0450 [Nematocida major]|uniref:uncharacterized protein n=1 Tax=Nematocida major TaxID=1912982 RepID=UPI0020077970|nr:uncharacterized protein NEMAJ01_0450 [Nematocida major]KAH9385554.1 hypothetical protein NEMAJ01_0450 [Nematocida major]